MSSAYELTGDVYTATAIQRACRDFEQLCTVTVHPRNNETHIRITPLVVNASIVDEFLNYVLALSAQELLA
jgi:hypothetical protein